MMLSVGTLHAQPADAPWPVQGHDVQRTGQSGHAGPEAPVEARWWVETGGAVLSSPAIGPDGTVYVGSDDEHLYAVGSDGSQRWRFRTCGRVASAPAVGPEGTVYVGTGQGAFHAIGPEGDERWTFTEAQRTLGSPAIGSDGTLYVGSRDGNVYALGPDGEQKWRFDTDVVGSDFAALAPAIGEDGTVYVASRRKGNLHALNPDGTEKWQYAARGEVFSPPVIGPDGTVYLGTAKRGELLAVGSDGTEEWRVRLGAAASTLALGKDGNIYVTGLAIGGEDPGMRLYAVDPSGEERWQFRLSGMEDDTDDPPFSAPAIGANGTIYVGSKNGRFYAIGPDGTKQWHFETGDGISSSPVIGAEGTVYVGSGDGHLYALGSSEETGTPSLTASVETLTVAVAEPDSEGEEFSGMQSFTLRNDGTAPLEGMVELSNPDGPFSVTEGSGSFALKPGGLRTITVRYASTEGGDQEGRLAVRPANGTEFEPVTVSLQGSDATDNSDEEEDVFVGVEEDPTLVGGMDALQSSVRYPEEAEGSGLEGKVFVKFVVDTDGTVQTPKVTRVIKGDCRLTRHFREEAVRAIESQEFRPGRNDGKPVKVQMALPVTFDAPSDQ